MRGFKKNMSFDVATVPVKLAQQASAIPGLSTLLPLLPASSPVTSRVAGPSPGLWGGVARGHARLRAREADRSPQLPCSPSKVTETGQRGVPQQVPPSNARVLPWTLY